MPSFLFSCDFPPTSLPPAHTPHLPFTDSTRAAFGPHDQLPRPGNLVRITRRQVEGALERWPLTPRSSSPLLPAELRRVILAYCCDEAVWPHEEEVRLVYKGHSLVDKQLLSDYGIQSEATLHVIFAPSPPSSSIFTS